MYEVLWAGEKFIKSPGIIWPLFYTAVFYLLFNGVLTLLFGWIEKKMDYFKLRRSRICLFWRYKHLYKNFGSTKVLKDISFYPGARQGACHHRLVRLRARPRCCAA